MNSGYFLTNMELLEKYDSTHDHIRLYFGLSERTPETKRIIAEFYHFSSAIVGHISIFDVMFLFDLVEAILPPRILEIGVGAGVSSIALLSALRAFSSSDPGLLFSYDVSHSCYFDRSTQTGFLVSERALDYMSSWKLQLGQTAKEAGLLFRNEKFSFAFIDANHKHPAPTADLLWLLPSLAPGAWVALHDINLPRVAEVYSANHNGKKVPWAVRGAKELFDGWPWEKICGRSIDNSIGATNIGAIRIPKEITARDLRVIIESPWEMSPNQSMLTVLGL